MMQHDQSLPEITRIDVAVVDDHAIMANAIAEMVGSDTRYRVMAICSSVDALLALDLHAAPSVLLLDIALEDESALARIPEIRYCFPALKIILVSMYDTEPYVLGAVRSGVAGFISKAAVHHVLYEALEIVVTGGVYFPDWCDVEQNIHPITGLSDRERLVLRLVALDKRPKCIAAELGCAAKTVHSHIANIGNKLGSRDRNSWIQVALSSGLISPIERV